MKKYFFKNKNKVFNVITLFSVTLLIVSIILAELINVNFLFITLIGLFLINYIGHIEQMSKWNHGICKETGIPWEFIECVEYIETKDWVFYSKVNNINETLFISPCSIIHKEYKGSKNLK